MCEAIQIDEMYDLAKGVCFFCEDTLISTPPKSNVDTKKRCDFLVHFITMDLYRYEFAEWCPLPAKAVGEGCVGIEPLFVRRWFGKCISFHTWLFSVSMLNFRGVMLFSNHVL